MSGRFVVNPVAGRGTRPDAYEIVDTHTGETVRTIRENQGDGSVPSTRGQALTHAANLNAQLSESQRTRYPCPKGCGRYFTGSAGAGEHAAKCRGIYRGKR